MIATGWFPPVTILSANLTTMPAVKRRPRQFGHVGCVPLLATDGEPFPIVPWLPLRGRPRSHIKRLSSSMTEGFTLIRKVIMSPYRMLMSVSLSLSLIGLVAAQGTAPPKAAPKAPPAVVKPAPKGPSSAVKTAPKASAATVPAAKAETKAAVPEAKPEKPETKAEEPEATAEENPHAADMAAIVKNAETFVAAFNQADAAALAELFTPDAEYIDETGEIFQGRQAIQDNLSGDFAENAGAQLELEIESIRFIGPGVAVEDGYSTLQDAESTVLSYNHYSAILVKVDDRWLTASVRDRAPKDRREHRAQLSQLNWLIGDWVDESPDSMVLFNCGPSDDGNFLVRTFTQHIEGEPQFHGTQWIGWDPLNQQIRSWTFDSDGGFSTGVW